MPVPPSTPTGLGEGPIYYSPVTIPMTLLTAPFYPNNTYQTASMNAPGVCAPSAMNVAGGLGISRESLRPIYMVSRAQSQQLPQINAIRADPYGRFPAFLDLKFTC